MYKRRLVYAIKVYINKLSSAQISLRSGVSAQQGSAQTSSAFMRYLVFLRLAQRSSAFIKYLVFLRLAQRGSAFIEFLACLRLEFCIFVFIWIWSLVFGKTKFLILALNLDIEGLKKLHGL